MDTDGDVSKYDVPTDGDEPGSLSRHLSSPQQSPSCVADPSLAHDTRRLDHGFRLRKSTAGHLQTGRQTREANISGVVVKPFDAHCCHMGTGAFCARPG